jgi:hypothetical protein
MAYNFTTKRLTDEDILIAKYNKRKYVFLTKEENEIDQSNEDKINEFYTFVNNKSLRLSQTSETNLKIAIRDGDTSLLTSSEKRIYEAFKAFNKDANKRLYTNDKFQLMPFYDYNKKQINRDVIYISGGAGAGKTYFISRYALEFNEIFHTSPIYFISSKRLKDETDYDNVSNIKQLDINDIEMLETVCESGKPFEYFSHKSGYSLVIFDDAEALPPKVEKLVQLILESILQIGRSKGIYCIISRHILCNNVKTKVIISECNKVVLFTNTLSNHAIKYFLTNYIGFDKNQINTVIDTKSRYCIINKNVPKYLMFEHEIILI